MRAVNCYIVLLAALLGCSPRPAEQNQKPVILVSILPQKTFVEKIAGEDVDVSILIPHGANPTTYSLLPAQMVEISRAKLWFRMGYVGFELSWAEKILQTNRELKVVDLSEGLDLITAGRDDKTGLPVGVDPHTWLSPSLVKGMMRIMYQELVEMNPGRKEVYMENYRKFLVEIEETDRKIRELLDGHAGRKFISFHPSLSYFAREYGLEQYSLEQRGKEPTSGHLAELINLALKEKIGVIYIQSDFDRENAEMFAREIKGEAIRVWPLNPDWSENLLSMANLLSENFR